MATCELMGCDNFDALVECNDCGRFVCNEHIDQERLGQNTCLGCLGHLEACEFCTRTYEVLSTCNSCDISSCAAHLDIEGNCNDCNEGVDTQTIPIERTHAEIISHEVYPDDEKIISAKYLLEMMHYDLLHEIDWSKIYQSESLELRGISIQIMGHVDPDKYGDLLVSILANRSESSEIIAEAALALGGCWDYWPTTSLQKCLHSEYGEVRKSSLLSLSKLWQRRRWGQEISSIRKIVEEMVSDNYSLVQPIAARFLGEICHDDSVPFLIATLNNGLLNTRIQAIISLGEIGHLDAVEPIIGILNDQSVRLVSIRALGKLKDERATPYLVNLLPVRTGDTLSVIEALGDIGDHRAINPLLELINEAFIFSDTMVYSITALGKIGDSKVLNDLRELLHSANAEQEVRYGEKHELLLVLNSTIALLES